MELIIENLGIGFGETNLFAGLDANLKSGESLAVLGCNGTGKSTFLRALAGLNAAKQGRILVSSNRLCFLPQTFEINKEIPISVIDFVELGTLALENTKEAVEATTALALVGIAPLAKKLIGQLSAGQFVKACLARNLVSNPDILILDEPFASLDATSAQEILQLLENLKALGKIIVVSIHDERLSIGFDHFVTLSGSQAKWEYKKPTHKHECELHDCKAEIEQAA